MNRFDRLWQTDPPRAYADWQAREAAGADRRPFSARSIVQHEAMFERFRRHLFAVNETLATFGSDHIEAFWRTPEAGGYSAATRMRYMKLLDRLCRHLVAIGVREGNPAEKLVRDGRWPQDDPLPIFLPEDADSRLQAHVQPHAGDNLPTLRSRAIVAFFFGTGVTVAEGRSAQVADLHPAAAPPYLRVPAHGARDTRTVHLDAFAVPILSAWIELRASLPYSGELLFSLQPSGIPIAEMSLGRIVRAALAMIDFEADDMSPRVLRNTFCRRQLLAGRSSEDVSKQLGLVSSRTCDRIAATIE
ncbi:integrase/recombinase [Cupriavidus basilensis OR16]|uniref:Integrase/recombinase n=2 Tax=Cupriavidus basilensis TaxID=68895 RepID=H1RZY0_9BURK|nr:integrase/recombinase [Cupriavidus basilensis OR16]